MSESIEQERPPDFPPVSDKLHPREKVAGWFAIAIFCLCAVLSLGLGLYWYLHTPSAVSLTGSPADMTAQLQNFRTQKDIVVDEVSKIFDLLVAKAFLPIFATVIGYLLGKCYSKDDP
jgi:hypothetical protein